MFPILQPFDCQLMSPLERCSSQADHVRSTYACDNGDQSELHLILVGSIHSNIHQRQTCTARWCNYQNVAVAMKRSWLRLTAVLTAHNDRGQVVHTRLAVSKQKNMVLAIGRWCIDMN